MSESPRDNRVSMDAGLTFRARTTDFMPRTKLAGETPARRINIAESSPNARKRRGIKDSDCWWGVIGGRASNGLVSSPRSSPFSASNRGVSVSSSSSLGAWPSSSGSGSSCRCAPPFPSYEDPGLPTLPSMYFGGEDCLGISVPSPIKEDKVTGGGSN